MGKNTIFRIGILSMKTNLTQITLQWNSPIIITEIIF